MNASGIWVRNCETAEELEALFEEIVAYGQPADIALMRQRLRRNTRQQVEAQHVISLTMSYLRGGETSRRNPESQVRRKERLVAEAGLPLLGFPDGLDDDAA